MTISIDLSPEQMTKLDEAARIEGLDISKLLVKIADDYLDRKGAFETVAQYVLKKNAELYRRLAQ